jgi:hypothetical protein
MTTTFAAEKRGAICVHRGRRASVAIVSGETGFCMVTPQRFEEVIPAPFQDMPIMIGPELFCKVKLAAEVKNLGPPELSIRIS